MQSKQEYQREYQKAYRERNREALVARHKAWYEANKANVSARMKVYYKENRERLLTQSRQYQDTFRQETLNPLVDRACSIFDRLSTQRRIKFTRVIMDSLDNVWIRARTQYKLADRLATCEECEGL
jgi:hypothetical protein